MRVAKRSCPSRRHGDEDPVKFENFTGSGVGGEQEDAVSAQDKIKQCHVNIPYSMS